MKIKLYAYFILASLLSVAVILKPALAADGQIKIALTSSTTFPILINKAGSYVLTSHLVVSDPNVNAIEIAANDVTLDLNGFTIRGPGSTNASGISALNQYNITIRNGRIWGFFEGIILVNSQNDHNYRSAGHRIEWLHAANNMMTGIFINAGIVMNCSANNNQGWGIVTQNSLIARCIANNNGQDGFQVEDSIISYCTAHYNQQNGIHDIGKSRIEGNNVRNNDRYGLSLASAGGSYVIKNASTDNGDANYDVSYGNYVPDTGDNANYGF